MRQGLCAFVYYCPLYHNYRGHTDAVLCLQFDEDKLVSGSKDTTIKVHYICITIIYKLFSDNLIL